MAEVTARTVEQRVEDWVQRLDALYDTLDEWTGVLPNVRVERGSLEQVVEPLMSRFDVSARAIPTWTVFQGKKRIAFVPSAIWIVGANGRVNVTTNRHQHMLVDLGGRDGRASDWQLVVNDARKLVVPFDQGAFNRLVSEAA